jgi:hypothetical protein
LDIQILVAKAYMGKTVSNVLVCFVEAFCRGQWEVPVVEGEIMGREFQYCRIHTEELMQPCVCLDEVLVCSKCTCSVPTCHQAECWRHVDYREPGGNYEV